MLDYKSLLKMSITSLKINKMRSMLTSLGIIIGVSAVIIMLAVGNGASKKIAAEMEAMGSNLLMIHSASAKSGGVRMGMGTKPTLTLKDAVAIDQKARGVLAVAPYSSETQQVTYGNQNWSTSIAGTSMSYFMIRNYDIDEGRGFLPEDTKNGTKVAIIGQTVSTELFGDVDPIGKTIRIGNIPFKVVGLLKSKGSSGMGQDQDDLVFIPITTAQRKVFGTDFPGTVNMITVKAQNDEVISLTQEDITEILRKRHHIGTKQDDDFEIRNLAEMQESIKSTTKTMSLLLGAIAGVSLIVGGIGIMNIMLVSVTERTKEIGIRMAIGAKASDIRIQFLIESFILSMAGGLIGVFVGILGAYLMHHFAGMNIAITLSSVLLSLGFSAAIGIGFGYYPAYKASRLNPIEALRYE
ncbi:MAG: ABC transporter permease [Cyanobacteriota bacterium]|nr:ABC transporter permease [Cyanobacteriota bacterium]MDY6357887.1 ABC transporter permease [Cyanobacteriota bacterium]MDY6364231.1 ABC transporter permease [Cyanobacteriota bacterium]MDY6383165.1 ABC transporter permease [Cyanobacteriota bacterium]